MSAETEQPPIPSPKATAEPDAAVTAGRGVLFIAVAKFYFMVSGYVIQFALWPLLGEKLYGDYGVVKNLASWFNNVVVTGTIQSVSKFTAERPEQADAIKRAALRMQLFFGFLLGLVLFLGAPWFAGLLHDPSLVPYLRIASGIVVCYSFYAVFVGSANGRRQFLKQAGLDMTYSTLRPTLIIIGAVSGLAVAGALGGFLAASFLIMVFALFVVGLKATKDRFSAFKIAAFMAPLLLYMLDMNLLLMVDQFLMKRLVAETAQQAGLAGAAAIASKAAGNYEATQTLARIPYQAILAIAFVIFPMVSRTTFEQDHATTRTYVSQTMRYSLIFSTALAVVLSAKAYGVLAIPFGFTTARTAAAALTVLALGQVFFSLFTIAGTILNGAGRTLGTNVVSFLTLAGAAVIDYIAIPRAGLDTGRVLLWTGAAQSVALVIGFVLMGGYLRRALGALLPPATAARVLIAGAAAWGVGRLLPDLHRGKLVAAAVTAGECVVVLAVFLGLLAALREFTADDRAKLRKVLRRR
ncbi:MAG TPA: oligosaccharide flippase family protein [Polyangia bacterium]|jgi:O-antigen/teichoic acid export membrane protein